MNDNELKEFNNKITEEIEKYELFEYLYEYHNLRVAILLNDISRNPNDTLTIDFLFYSGKAFVSNRNTFNFRMLKLPDISSVIAEQMHDRIINLKENEAIINYKRKVGLLDLKERMDNELKTKVGNNIKRNKI